MAGGLVSSLTLPAGTEVTALDRVEVGDDVWEVDGDPVHARRGGAEVLVKVALKRVTG